MKKLILVTLFIAFVGVFNTHAQQWKRYRKEHVFALGATNFLGDLGGRDNVGKNTPLDLDISATKMALSYMYRYRLKRKWYGTGFINMGMLRGSDAFTDEAIRNNRNLSFRSPIIEMGGRFEYMISKDRAGHRYNIKKARGFRSFNLQSYAFIGFGAFWFNPQAQLPSQLKSGGDWYNLHARRTEGQGLSPGSKKIYSRFSISIPYGIGVKRNINKEYLIGLELCMRKVFTDYIDDVSTTYVNKALFNGDPIAIELADPSKNKIIGATIAGEQRGDPRDKDNFMNVSVTLTKKILPRRTKAKF